jgi:WD40 repeat protein
VSQSSARGNLSNRSGTVPLVLTSPRNVQGNNNNREALSFLRARSVCRVRFSHDDTLLLSSWSDNTVRVYDLAAERVVYHCTCVLAASARLPDNSISEIAFS